MCSKKATVALTTLLLVVPVAASAGNPLPDPERGSIGVTVKDVDTVYFVELDDSVDNYRAGYGRRGLPV